jgi:ABC-type multidrug transport system ATPase subunit/ABC-type multidrug transport system permease subunit
MLKQARAPLLADDADGAATSTEKESGKKPSKHKHGVSRKSPSDAFQGKYAVDVRGLDHAYPSNKKGTKTLDGIDLQIEVGKIYGLLGPSGCGKTTLIKCILAQLEPSEGTILCFGEKPGSQLSEVPGHDCGFMPQEIALYDEFTVMQNLSFYAKLHGMSAEEFQDRSKYLCKLLDLKDPTKKNVKQLSGGQQRRCSLACSLLHSPKLLILDEPTVGVDPTLRMKIWKYLVKVSQKEGTSILLTTHYIEEARRADAVGLMRNGRMLDQGSPDEIMRKTGQKTLEEAFLRICREDEKNEEKNGGEDDNGEGKDKDEKRKGGDNDSDSSSIDLSDSDADSDPDSPSAASPRSSPSSTTRARGSESPTTFSSVSRKDLTSNDPASSAATAKKGGRGGSGGKNVQGAGPERSRRFSNEDADSSSKGGGSGATPLKGWAAISHKLALPRPGQLWALCWKNLARMRKGVAALIFQFVMPSIQVILFCVAIGKDPQHIRMGLVDLDVGTSASGMQMQQQGIPTPAGLYAPSIRDAPIPPFLSTDFRDFLNDEFIIDSFSTEEEAREAVEKNDVWGYVVLPTAFTANTLQRINETLVNPLGISNETLANSTIRYTLDMSNEQMTIFLVKAIAQAYSNLINKYAPGLDRYSPLQMGDPVYGDADASYTDFIAPGILITIAFSGSIGLTAITFVLDKKTGNLDRIWSSGVWASEIMLAQVLTQILIFVIQIALLLVFGLVVFKLPLHGSLFLLFSVCLLLGVTGMMFGLVIASKVSEERDAMQVALGSFFPALLLSGVMWPIEAIPTPLYQIALGLPTTWAAEAGRSIMSRGWGLEHRQVWLGILVPFIWSFVFFLWAAKSLRAKK